MKQASNAEQAKAYITERDYKMEILHDMGVHRCLKFKNGDSHNGYFMITTWPGHLAISGDMGCFVFSRLNDMVEFFNGDGINPGYWEEKVQAESLFGSGIKEFDIESFKEKIEEVKNQWLHDSDEEHHEEINEAFDIKYMEEDEWGAVEFVRNISLDGFDDYGSLFANEYTFRYLFACYAIQFACNTYLKHKEKINVKE